MKHTPTEHTHTGYTAKDLTISFKPSSSAFTHQVSVPAGTACVKLDGGSNPWVVNDLSFIGKEDIGLRSDADIYGIRIQETDLVDIQSIKDTSTRPRQNG